MFNATDFTSLWYPFLHILRILTRAFIHILPQVSSSQSTDYYCRLRTLFAKLWNPVSAGFLRQWSFLQRSLPISYKASLCRLLLYCCDKNTMSKSNLKKREFIGLRFRGAGINQGREAMAWWQEREVGWWHFVHTQKQRENEVRQSCGPLKPTTHDAFLPPRLCP